jgi:hypothetical protein
MAECPKCGGEMREGEVFVTVTTPSVQSSTFGMMDMLGTVFPGVEMTRDEKIRWREKTGRKTGPLKKGEDERIMKTSGRRCMKCGYIELYAQE